MHNYDFHERLDWKEFENFATEIIQKREQISLTVTPSTHDDGIDFHDDQFHIIGQVKNFQNDKQQLMRELKEVRASLEGSKNIRFILVTSYQYTTSDRKKILELFKGYLKPSDLLGKSELNLLLDDQKTYGEIELAFFKLYLPSSKVLFHTIDHTLNRDIYNNSEMEWKNLQKSMSVFAPNKDYYQAYQKFANHHVLIISGKPGIGKTTLGYALVSTFLNTHQDYQFINVLSVEQLARIYQLDKKQIFFYDDFWGNTKYEHTITSSMQKSLFSYLQEIMASSNKYIVLTTREYIFQTGMERFPFLANSFERKKYFLELTEDNKEIKLQILMNHLEKSNANYDEIQNILEEWESVVYHRNYTPRLIGTFFENIPEVHASNYKIVWDLVDYLDHPTDYWTLNLKAQSFSTQLILYILSLAITGMDYDILKEEYYHLLRANHLENNNDLLQGFEEGIASCEKTFTTIYETKDRHKKIRIQNASFAEFLQETLKENLNLVGIWMAKGLTELSLLKEFAFLLDSCERTNLVLQIQSLLETTFLSSLDTWTVEKNTSKLREIVHMIQGLSLEHYPRLTDYAFDFYRSASVMTDFYRLHYLVVTNYVTLIELLLPLKPEIKENAYGIINACIDYISNYEEWESFLQLKELFPNEWKELAEDAQYTIKELLEETILDHAEELYLEEEPFLIGMMLEEELPKLYHELGYRVPKHIKNKLKELYEISDQKSENEWENDDIYEIKQKKKL